MSADRQTVEQALRIIINFELKGTHSHGRHVFASSAKLLMEKNFMPVLKAASSDPCITIKQIKAIGGPLARLHLECLHLVARISSWFGNRGMRRLSWILGNYIFSKKHDAVLELAAGGKFKIHLRDGYWTKLLIPNYAYEPEVWAVLSRVVRETNVFLLDCGANIGYWSVVCSQIMPAKQVLAIEAAPPNYEQLLENAQLNAGRFDLLLSALWERDGEDIVVVSHELRHAGSSVVDRRDKMGRSGYRDDTVSTVTLNTICERYVKDPTAKIVIKLDIEGAETAALEGAWKMFDGWQTLVVYEDHGQDSGCRVSDYFLSKLGFVVCHCDEKLRVTQMHSIEDVRELKKNPSVGYNLIAFSPNSFFSTIFLGS